MKKALLGIVLLLFVHGLYAQSSQVVTEILNADKVTFGQVSYLVAVQEGLVDETASYADAVEALYYAKQIPSLIFDESYVPAVNLCYMYAQMFNIKGGLMYKLFHGAPRYAYKQMKYDGIFQDNIYPDKLLSGSEALNIYTACLMKYTDFQLSVE